MTTFKRLDYLLDFTAEELRQDSTLARAIELVRDLYFTYDADEISVGRDVIKRVLENTDSRLGKVWEGRRQYERLLTLLRFGTPAILSNDELKRLFSQHLLSLGAEKPAFKDRLQFAVYMWGDYEGIYRRLLLELISHNTERLGETTIQNWLKDYVSISSSLQPGNLRQVTYLNQSQLVKKLTATERDILMNLLQTYDWLRTGAILPAELILPERKLSAVRLYSQVAVSPQPKLESIPGPTLMPRSPVVGSASAVALKTVPVALKSPEPAFFFDLEDEEEVDKYRMPNDQFPISKTLEQNLRLLAEEVIAEHNFQFKEDVSRRRFVQLFVSFMKDVRDIMEAKEMLLKSTSAGGLGLTSDKVDIVVNIFRKLRAELPEKIKIWESRIENLESRKPAVTKVAPKPTMVTPPVVAPVKSAPQTMPNIKANADQLAEWRQELLAEIAKTSRPPKAKPVPIKPKLVDVEAPPRTLGPIEELKDMKLIDFRRLGKTAGDVIGKIQAKIQLIGETGIGRRLQAVRAWQASPVYQLYLTLGRESIEQAKSVDSIIATRQADGQETLTLAEFEAIADLNQKLRF